MDQRIDFTGLRSKDAMLGAVATALKFPRHFSPNLDALNDCLTDLSFKSGAHRITLVKLSNSATGEAIHAVFKSAARQWKKHGASVALIRE